MGEVRAVNSHIDRLFGNCTDAPVVSKRPAPGVVRVLFIPGRPTALHVGVHILRLQEDAFVPLMGGVYIIAYTRQAQAEYE